MESFCFLSHHQFVLSRTHHRRSTTTPPLLQVYEFLDSEALPFKLTPRLVRSFQLPRPVAGGLVTKMNIRSEPPRCSPSQNRRQGKPFTTRAGSQVLAVSIDIFQPVRGMNFDRNSYVLFIHHSTLLQGLENQWDVVIPWDKWGPNKTRLLRTEYSEQIWVYYMHGSRYVTLDGERLRMLDFNPWPIRRGEIFFLNQTSKLILALRLGHSSRYSNPDKKDNDLTCTGMSGTLESTSQDVRCRVISALEPTKLSRGRAFGEDVETRLPYRDICSDELFDLHAIMIDQDCLVALHREVCVSFSPVKND